LLGEAAVALTLETMDPLARVAGDISKPWNIVVLHHTQRGITLLLTASGMLIPRFRIASTEAPVSLAINLYDVATGRECGAQGVANAAAAIHSAQPP
jgi:hypothetical protein